MRIYSFCANFDVRFKVPLGFFEVKYLIMGFFFISFNYMQMINQIKIYFLIMSGILSQSVFKPYLMNYKTDGTGRDTYIYVNDQRLTTL